MYCWIIRKCRHKASKNQLKSSACVILHLILKKVLWDPMAGTGDRMAGHIVMIGKNVQNICCKKKYLYVGWRWFSLTEFHCYNCVNTVWKASKCGVFSGPYFLAFGLNTEKYEVSLRIQSEYGKIRTRKNSVFGHISHSEHFLWSYGYQFAS